MKNKLLYLGLLPILYTNLSCAGAVTTAQKDFLTLVAQCKMAMNNVEQMSNAVSGWTIPAPSKEQPALRNTYLKTYPDSSINVQYQTNPAVNLCRVILYTPQAINLESNISKDIFPERIHEFSGCEVENGAKIKEAELTPNLFVQYYQAYDPARKQFISAVEMQKVKSNYFKYYSICEHMDETS